MNTERIREPVAWEVQAQLRPLYIDGADLSLDVVDQIHQWARQCVADEREACAKVCEDKKSSYEERASRPGKLRDIKPEVVLIAGMTCDFIAAAIRARGNDAVDIK